MAKIKVSDSGKTYELIQKLGAGTYGTTWMAAQHSEGGKDKKVAVKVFSRPGKLDQDKIEDIEEDWTVEINALKKVLSKCSPHAVCIKDYWFGKDGAYIVMDFVRGESLKKQIVGGSKGISLSKRKNDHTLLKNLISGIEAIHSQGVAHQDIKGDNIMYDYDYNDGYYRYIDFGLSCVKKSNMVEKSRENFPCGTIGTRYTSPKEIVQTKGKKVVLDWKILEAHDYWSIGIMLLRWYTFDGSPYYYINVINDFVDTDKQADKLANTTNSYGVFPYYYNFPKEMLDCEIGKIKEPSARVIVGLLLEQDPMKRWNNFKTVKYILDPEAKLADGDWGVVKDSIEKLRLF